ncbi:hypothetical protein, partial [Salmonella sp. gx-f7]|uniref:hypothetical protein n=1 Tax=Salmonella sp. gx-f7 TaxID=2582606 RepID=UPI001F2CC352
MDFCWKLGPCATGKAISSDPETASGYLTSSSLTTAALQGMDTLLNFQPHLFHVEKQTSLYGATVASL